MSKLMYAAAVLATLSVPALADTTHKCCDKCPLTR
jgi:hypothetical protein